MGIVLIESISHSNDNLKWLAKCVALSYLNKHNHFTDGCIFSFTQLLTYKDANHDFVNKIHRLDLELTSKIVGKDVQI